MSEKGKSYPGEIYTPDEVNSLLKVCSKRAPTGLRNRALLVLGYRAGLRITEALSLKPADIDLDEGYVHVRDGKGGKSRKVGLDIQACEIVRRWVEIRKTLCHTPNRWPLFCTLDGEPLKDSYVRAMLARLGNRAGIEKRLHFHGLRHTFAWELCKEGVPMIHIQRLLGHANLQTTAVYLAHIAPHELIAVAHERPAWSEG